MPILNLVIASLYDLVILLTICFMEKIQPAILVTHRISWKNRPLNYSLSLKTNIFKQEQLAITVKCNPNKIAYKIFYSV